MKAIRLHHKGGPEQLVYEDAPRPALRPGDALVRVKACAITPPELTWSTTYTTREGVERLPTIPGHELSGIVAAVADDVTIVGEGQPVYALTDFWRDGAAAEFIAVRAADLAPKPRNLNDEQSAAVPLSGLTAWQALFEHAGLTKGQRILIHGAAGGVGTYAVQLARWRGAYVIGTAQANNAEFLRELGVDQVIDYNAVRFENEVHDADVVLDTVGGETRDRSWGVLRRGGVLVTIVGSVSAEKAAQYGVRAVDFIVHPSRDQLLDLARLIEACKLLPVIEAVIPLEHAKLAYERALSGHNRGKVVLRVAGSAAVGK